MIALKMASNIDELFGFYANFADVLEPEMAMSVNRFASTMGAHMRRHILKTRAGFTKDDIEEFADWKITKKARPNDLEAEMVIKGKKIPLIRFISETQNKKMQGSDNKGGVEFTLFGRTHRHPKAFVNNVYGSTQVHLRKHRNESVNTKPKRTRGPMSKYASGSDKTADKDDKRLIGRFPLFNLQTVSIPQIADDDDVVGFALVGAERQFIKQLDHTISRMAEGFV